MNILALVRNAVDLESVIDYLVRISPDTHAYHILNVINTPGDIPTKQNGEVLDQCTEFDLTPYHLERSRNKQWLEAGLASYPDVKFTVAVGNQYALLADHIRSGKVDMVLTSTELTDEREDLLSLTKAELLHRELTIPVLAFKCDRSEREINHIAVISDYLNPEQHDLSAFRSILQHTQAELGLYGFYQGDTGESELADRMDSFAAVHGLNKARKVMINASNKEKSVQRLVVEHAIDLLVVLDIQRHGMDRVLRGDLETDILNHTLVPILAY